VEKAAVQMGAQTLLIKADVAKSQEVHDMVNLVIKNWGRIDVLINNAGITRDRTILKMTDEEWEDVLKVNLNGAFWCLRDSSKAMIERKDGAILNISSIAAMRGGSVGNANYAASKAGLIALTKSAAKELGRFNIRVNAILPGFHLTDMGRTVWKKYEERIRSEHILGRLPDIRELAQFVLFLAKQKSVSGQVLNFESRVI
jgi:NAD(P)-dependent dehydrogenase (short-subunit alcohol dehydrogenase family)